MRAISAVIGLPILFAAIWFNPDDWRVFFALTVAVAILASLEISSLSKGWGYPFHFLVPLLTGFFWFLIAQRRVTNGDMFLYARDIGLWDAAQLYPWPEIMILVAFALSTQRMARATGGPLEFPPTFERLYIGVHAGIYLSGPLIFAIMLRALDQGPAWLTLVLLTVFANDTTAFLIGRTFGRRHFVPNVSPSKTVEGAIAGLVGAVVACATIPALLSTFFGIDLEISLLHRLLMGLMIGLLAQIGDLVESRMKRVAQVKDSGWLVPGHGGILDRIDSVLLALPASYYFLVWAVGVGLPPGAGSQ